MARVRIKEYALDLKSFPSSDDPMLEKRKTIAGPILKTPVFQRATLFKLALIFNDLILTIFGFCVGQWIIGRDAVVFDDFYKTIAFLVLGLPVIAYFQPCHLYDFHLIFLIKKHLKNLLK